jgi:electron transfer flavoprotein-quinone oxidoreductase
MAKAGLDVLVIERGDTAGSKNMTGGRLYAHSLEKIIPGFAQSAPLSEKLPEKISFLTNDSAVTLDYQAPSRDANPEQASWTVLRHGFDSWLMEQAEAVGAQFITGVRVDALIHQQGRVTGVQAGEDVLEANVVVLADGVNSLLGRSIGLVQKSNLIITPSGLKSSFHCQPKPFRTALA